MASLILLLWLKGKQYHPLNCVHFYVWSMWLKIEKQDFLSSNEKKRNFLDFILASEDVRIFELYGQIVH